MEEHVTRIAYDVSHFKICGLCADETDHVKYWSEQNFAHYAEQDDAGKWLCTIAPLSKRAR
jgi:hypothetical protein